MNFTPFPILKTNRLLLRKSTLADRQEVFYLRSDAEVNKYIKREPMQKIEEAAAFINKIAKEIETGNSIEWSITLIGKKTVIGSVCIWNINESEMTGELGYSLMTKYHNKGIMTETIACVLDYGFNTMNLKLIDAYTHSENKASIALLLKNGFIQNKNKVDEGNEHNLIFESTSENYIKHVD